MLLTRDPFSDVDTVKPMGDGLKAEERWHEVLCGQWQHPEAIHVLECRAGLMAARRTLRKLENRDRRRLLLTDNMSFVLAMSK
eukprot:11918306-Heterocapsa_arctica.AAC.1